MDSAGFVVLAATLCLAGLLVIVIVRQAANGDLPRNGLIGLRTKATRRSDAAWTAGHQAAIPWVRLSVGLGSGLAILGAIVSFTSVPVVIPAVLSGLGYLAFVGLLLWAIPVANRAAKAAE